MLHNGHLTEHPLDIPPEDIIPRHLLRYFSCRRRERVKINPDIAAIARMNLFLHGLTNWSIERGDSLADPAFTDGDNLERFDYVLANFPFSADWPKDDLQDDPWGRFDWADKLPRADRGDYAF